MNLLGPHLYVLQGDYVQCRFLDGVAGGDAVWTKDFARTKMLQIEEVAKCVSQSMFY